MLCRKECCICYDNYFFINKCNKCYNCYICYKCLNNIENIKQCPMCRQPNWINISDRKIYPNNLNQNVVVVDIDNNSDQIDYKRQFKIIFHVITWLVIAWIIGFATILSFSYNNDLNNLTFLLAFISILIGICEIVVFWCCFCRSINLFKIITNDF